MPSLFARVFAAVVGLGLLAGLAGCGGAAGEEPGAAARSLDPPVQVKHRLGTTEVREVPKRIVTIDQQWTDVMLAMGVQPVGYSVDPRMPESGVPWQELSKDAKPLSIDGGVPVAEIAELKPDLILGTWLIKDEETYGLLSDIAPTIATLDAKQVTPWQQLVRVAGRVLDDEQRAESVIDSVDKDVAAVAEELPGLKGKTFLLAQYIVGDKMVVVADEKDGSSVFFQQLGMRLYPPVVEQGEKTGMARINLSLERADLLRSDLLTFLINGGDKKDLADIPGFEDLPGTVAVLDYATIVGLNTPSPLSIPYALEKLRPSLEKAAAA